MDKTNNNWNGKITIRVDHSISTLTKIHTDHFNMKQYPNKYKHKTDGSDRIVTFSYVHLRCRTTPQAQYTNDTIFCHQTFFVSPLKEDIWSVNQKYLHWTQYKRSSTHLLPFLLKQNGKQYCLTSSSMPNPVQWY